MKVEGMILPEEIPGDLGLKVFGVWTGLAVQVIEAHKQGKVLVVVASDRLEFIRMRNGMGEKLRVMGYRRRFTTVVQTDGSIKVYCQLRNEPEPVVVQPLKRPRRQANG